MNYTSTTMEYNIFKNLHMYMGMTKWQLTTNSMANIKNTIL